MSDYDERRINFARLWERIIAGVINVLIYGAAILAARWVGIL